MEVSLERTGADFAGYRRRVLVLAAAATMLAAILGGLARAGVLPASVSGASSVHGPLIVFGTFGTLISLERAVALAHRWALAVPVLFAASAIAIYFGRPYAGALVVLACLGLVWLDALVVRRAGSIHAWLMLAGAIVLVLGAAVWAFGRPVFEAVPAWIAFFVLTISAERLQLSELVPKPAWAAPLLLAIACVFAGSASFRVFVPASSARVFGISMLLLGVWLLAFDVARRTLRTRGLPRYSAVGVLLGAAWLAIAGLLFALGPPAAAGPHYDAALHAVFGGFVFSMVFAHAPIILPAVARVPLPFHPALYAPLVLLHGTLVLRLAGDAAGIGALVRFGALGNALSLVAFAACALYARRARR